MITSNTTCMEIISLGNDLGHIIERFGITYAPEETLKQAAERSGNNADFLVEILKAYANKQYFSKENLYQYNLPCLLDYLRKTHRYYIQKLLPHMEQSIVQLIKNFAEDFPELVRLSKIFLKYKEDLEIHITQEEKILFPYIEDLMQAAKRPVLFTGIKKKYSIATFTGEHQDNHQSLPKIRKILYENSGAPLPPMPYRIFLIQIKMFEDDLLIHGKVEDEILIPKSYEMEKYIMGNSFNIRR